MTNTLVIQPTEMAEWHALITEAGAASSIKLSEDLESYLVFLLMRFTHHPEIANALLALDFLRNIKKVKNENWQILKDIADKCLLFAGLFPGMAKRRRVRISYYVSLGQNAYDSLAHFDHHQMSALFSKLSQHFIGLMDVLQFIQNYTRKPAMLDLLATIDLWHDTHSISARKTVENATNGFLIPPDRSAPLRKH